MDKIKVLGFDNLSKDVRSKAVINTSKTEYQIYMSRIKTREVQGDQIRNTVKEINMLKKELTEIKNMLKEVLQK